jgi:hypothetical protein
MCFRSTARSVRKCQWKIEGWKGVHDRNMAGDKPGNITLSGVAIPWIVRKCNGNTGTKGGLVATDLHLFISLTGTIDEIRNWATLYRGFNWNLRFPKKRRWNRGTWEGETATTTQRIMFTDIW